MLKISDVEIEEAYDDCNAEVSIRMRHAAKKADRTGTGTQSIFGHQTRITI